MDEITIGLDFGTHQTKICIQVVPDEGHGHPSYSFFTFKDNKGKNRYFLPSIIQINEDNTLSYGYVDRSKKKKKKKGSEPILNLENVVKTDFDISEKAAELYSKYATPINSPDDISAIVDMLAIRKKKLEILRQSQMKEAQQLYEQQLQQYKKDHETLRYFKQATFTGCEWYERIDCKTLSIWYLSYVIFLLEQKFGENFALNMGVPADDRSFSMRKKHAIEILLSAYNLVEEVYHNDLDAFLTETIDNLLSKTNYIAYSAEAKDYYRINIFPEAYAGLVCMAAKGKLSDGPLFSVDIGGGTTDISFSIIKNRQQEIYRYWSIPCGLNYLAEKSGFDYAEYNLMTKADKRIVEDFTLKIRQIAGTLYTELLRDLKRKTNLDKRVLNSYMENRPIVYNGGGSTLSFLTEPIHPFNDVILIHSSMWKEENIRQKGMVSEFCQLLTIAFGLSVCKSDQEIKLYNYSTLFEHIQKREVTERKMIDKDCC